MKEQKKESKKEKEKPTKKLQESTKSLILFPGCNCPTVYVGANQGCCLNYLKIMEFWFASS